MKKNRIIGLICSIILATGCTENHYQQIKGDEGALEASGRSSGNLLNNNGPTVREPHRGTVDGGGGKAVVCREANGKIKSIELLDLYEARVLYRRKIEKTKMPIKAQIERAFKRLSPGVSTVEQINDLVKINVNHTDGFELILKGEYEGVAKNAHFLKNTSLVPTNDAFEAIYPKGCGVEQVADYLKEGKLIIDEELYNSMDKINQAALWVHETLYSYLRFIQREKDSLSTRRAVGYVFSGKSLPPQVPDLSDKDEVLKCTGHSSYSPESRSLDSYNFFVVNYPKASEELEFGKTAYEDKDNIEKRKNCHTLYFTTAGALSVGPMATYLCGNGLTRFEPSHEDLDRLGSSSVSSGGEFNSVEDGPNMYAEYSVLLDIVTSSVATEDNSQVQLSANHNAKLSVKRQISLEKDGKVLPMANITCERLVPLKEKGHFRSVEQLKDIYAKEDERTINCKQYLVGTESNIGFKKDMAYVGAEYEYTYLKRIVELQKINENIFWFDFSLKEEGNKNNLGWEPQYDFTIGGANHISALPSFEYTGIRDFFNIDSLSFENSQRKVSISYIQQKETYPSTLGKGALFRMTEELKTQVDSTTPTKIESLLECTKYF